MEIFSALLGAVVGWCLVLIFTTNPFACTAGAFAGFAAGIMAASD